MTDDVMEPKIKAIAPWFGGKRTLAPQIIAEIGSHRAYWEPFCGSMAILIGKPKCSMETVNDLHGDLVNLARVVRDIVLGPQLYRRLRRTLVCQQFLEDSREELNAKQFEASQDPDIDRAYVYFVNSWLSMNGTAGTFAGVDKRRGISRRFSSGGGSSSIRFAAAVDSIPAWRRRLRTVMILNDDGIDLCDRIEDKEGTVIYCDPPYVEKSEEYVHDFANEHHIRLADRLSVFKKTRVLVSYYEHPSLQLLYPRFTKINLSLTKGLGKQRGELGATSAPEVLLVNGPSLRQAELF